LSAPKVTPGVYGLEPKDSRGRMSNALPLDRCLHIARELASCGIKQVDLTGGEPLMRADIEEIVKSLTAYQIDIGTLFTNAALLTEKTLDIFERYNQHPVVQVSYDGKGHHDWMRGISGAEQTVIDAFRLLTERKFTVVAAMCIHKENRDCLRDTVNFLASIGIDDLRVNAPQLLGMWRTYSEEYALTEEEVWETYRAYIGHFYEDGMPVTLSLDGYFHCPKGSTDYKIRYLRGFQPDTDWGKTYYCGSMQSHIYITAEGRILPCMAFADTKLNEKFPLITENSLGDITREGFWKDIADTRIMNLLERNPECAECEYLHDCGGGCLAQNMTQEGDFLIPDSRICYFFKNVGADAVKQIADQAIRNYQRNHTQEPAVKAIHAKEVNHERGN
jgi:radical SAM protein with 4Fe4S-binding SPASM domain